jgi:cyclic beta-1,2-glucan synthetase
VDQRKSRIPPSASSLESGAGYTWSRNSRENQLTAWSNDPVSDPPGETIYVRDEETGDLWGPTPLPIREDASPYVARHGQGYSRFEHTAHGIFLSLLQFVPVDDPVKISRLTIENRSGNPASVGDRGREWVLGSPEARPRRHHRRSIRTLARVRAQPWNIFGERGVCRSRGRRPMDRRSDGSGWNGTLDHPALLGEEIRRPSRRQARPARPCRSWSRWRPAGVRDCFAR